MIQYAPIRVRPKRSPQAQREVRRDTPLRTARTCYGHLAGVAGVALMEELLGREWLEEEPVPVSGNRVRYALTTKGRQAMEELGVEVSTAAKSTGNFAFGCLDWTEPGLHLGGSLGRAITVCLSERGFVGRTEGKREVTLDGSPRFWLT
ncbi:MAG TPA: hypothetical protein EYM75_07435 [Dehalococcoidia bacterium]|jgi:hypothetical protein|nr:hypothetical protein [Dehalococcoidia bacterium]